VQGEAGSGEDQKKQRGGPEYRHCLQRGQCTAKAHHLEHEKRCEETGSHTYD